MKKNKMLARTVATLAAVYISLFCALGLTAQTKPDGKEILRKVDAYREYSTSGFSFDFGVTEKSGSKSLMRVSLDSENKETSLVKYLEPKKYRRRVVLTIKNSFFVYDQGMFSPIRITPREMLFGQASAGDITRIAFSGMYSIEQVEKNEETWELSLKALPNMGATYDLIDLRVKRSDYKPIEAKCRGSSGILMKTITYDAFKIIDGKELLTEFTITEGQNSDSCKVVLDNFSSETYPSSRFTVEALPHVR